MSHLARRLVFLPKEEQLARQIRARDISGQSSAQPLHRSDSKHVRLKVFYFLLPDPQYRSRILTVSPAVGFQDRLGNFCTVLAPSIGLLPLHGDITTKIGREFHT